MAGTVAAVQRAALRRAVLDEGVASDHFVLAAALEGARRATEGDGTDATNSAADAPPDATDVDAPTDAVGGLVTATLASVLAARETGAPRPTSPGVAPDPERHRLLLDGAVLAHRRLDVDLATAAAAAGVPEAELRRHEARS